MPSGFSHFYCHRVLLSTRKYNGFLNISGRLDEIQPLKYHQRPDRSTPAARPKNGPLAAHARDEQWTGLGSDWIRNMSNCVDF